MTFRHLICMTPTAGCTGWSWWTVGRAGAVGAASAAMVRATDHTGIAIAGRTARCTNGMLVRDWPCPHWAASVSHDRGPTQSWVTSCIPKTCSQPSATYAQSAIVPTTRCESATINTGVISPPARHLALPGGSRGRLHCRSSWTDTLSCRSEPL